jgi:acetylornithine deacetylase/succinyl-diaminopimelate desuccinylase-like protein
MAAVRTIQLLGLCPQGDVVLGSCASKRHAQGIVAAFERGYATDGSIYLHPAESGHGFADLKAITCGALLFNVILDGTEPPTSEPNHVPFAHQAVNPIETAATVVAALKRMEGELARDWPHELLEHAMGGQGTRLSFGSIYAAAAPVRIPPRCELGVALVFPPGVPLAEVQAAVERTLAELSVDSTAPVRSRVEWLFGTEGAEVPRDHPLCEITTAAIRVATGTTPSVYALHATSDIRVPQHWNGTPCLGFGPLAGDSSQIGRSDEWIDEDDFLRMILACTLIVLAWCGYDRRA